MNSPEPYDDLEAELLALGDLIDVPGLPHSDVAAAVRARLEPTPEPRAPEPPALDRPAEELSGSRTPAMGTPGSATHAFAPPEKEKPQGEESHGERPDAENSEEEKPSGERSDGEKSEAEVSFGGTSGGGAPGGDKSPREVAGRRDSGRRGAAGRGRRTAGRRRARWKVVAAAVVAVLAVTAATPQGRAAVAAILRFAGVEVEIGDTPPEPVTTRTSLPAERTVSLADIPELVDFAVRIPARLGEPRRVTVADHGRVVSMFWPGGVRLDQFSGAVGPYFYKQLGPPWPDHVMVGTYSAWWLPGEHPLGYIRRQDGTHVPLRQAASTLVWQRGTLNYRLEGAGDVDEAVAVARSLG
ncbi:hypothetical protein [Nonomuraea sp. B5E05]|uniref:hypothetical protein n=1 Tax=Nonomuraea sp. B5E05 TaxID=3153569 RepID=UPI003260B9C2